MKNQGFDYTRDVVISEDGSVKVDINKLPATFLIHYGHGRLEEEINQMHLGELLELFDGVHELVELVDKATLAKVREQLGITKQTKNDNDILKQIK